jgi:CubicO group peptidase (beta-lactamase class C family)
MKKKLPQLAMLFSLLSFTLITSAQPKVSRQMPPGVKATDADKHQIRPAHVVNVVSDNDDELVSVLPKAKVKNKQPNPNPKANWNEFMNELHKILKDSSQGHIIQINQNGSPIGNIKWSMAKTAIDGGQTWDFNTRMHIASVSKYLTALGVMKALRLKNLSIDTKISGYLPAYWSKGNNIDKITFRHLLTHRTGFKVDGDGSDFSLMRSEVAAGVSNVGEYSGYENLNFGLCRILIPVLMGLMEKDFAGGDNLWDVVSVAWFKSFMQDKIFTPAGVPNVGFAPAMGYKSANAYLFPYNPTQKGWNSGDLSTAVGGAGFRMSSSELLKVVDHALRRGTILDAPAVQTGLNWGLGINGSFSSPEGTVFYRKGRWKSSKGTEQTALFIFPDNIEVAVFVNSEIGIEKKPSHVASYIKSIYLNSFD